VPGTAGVPPAEGECDIERFLGIRVDGRLLVGIMALGADGLSTQEFGR
jgi:hypothetical protein